MKKDIKIIIGLCALALSLMAAAVLIRLKIIEVPMQEEIIMVLWGPPSIAAFVMLMVRFIKHRQFYNITIISLVSLVLIFLLARYSIPSVGPFLILSVGMIMFSFIFNCIIYGINKDANRLLKILSWFVMVVLFAFFYGFLALRMHWPGGEAISYSSIFLYVILFLGIIFNLPYSKYSEWNNNDKKMFFKGIAIPVLFAFALITFYMLFPEQYKNLLYGGRISNEYWGMVLE